MMLIIDYSQYKVTVSQEEFFSKSSEFTIDLFEEAWCPPENGAVVDPCWISGQDLPQLASYLCLRLGRDQGTFLLCCC